MKLRYIEEPTMHFGLNQHICPRGGIADYFPFDIEQVRPERIVIGMIGKRQSIEAIRKWLETCRTKIDAKKSKKGKKQNLNLFPPFPGFNKNEAFCSEIIFDDTYLRVINNSEFESIAKSNEYIEDRIEKTAELYLQEIKYLTQNKKPDVILCILSEEIRESIVPVSLKNDKKSDEDMTNHYSEPNDEDDEAAELEQNFRRYLKARAMQFQVPIQIVRDRMANPTNEMQDPATIAWNFFTALYYKAGGTPWALMRKDMAETTCYAGISFYWSRDRRALQTSIAQIFNEFGKGVILRGEEIRIPKDDKTPHLTEQQAFALLHASLREYIAAIKHTPKRIVIHKTSNFNQAEINGFNNACREFHIQQVDMAAIMLSDFRVYRQGQYPPLRGTHISFSDRHHVLYTRGSVPYYETYPGQYIPKPIEIKLFQYDESPDIICEEILALTKLNWNNTQFDGQMPITIDCARNVGTILKYLGPEDEMQLKYSFYM